jgi:hypothetical protein
MIPAARPQSLASIGTVFWRTRHRAITWYSSIKIRIFSIAPSVAYGRLERAVADALRETVGPDEARILETRLLSQYQAPFNMPARKRCCWHCARPCRVPAPDTERPRPVFDAAQQAAAAASHERTIAIALPIDPIGGGAETNCRSSFFARPIWRHAELLPVIVVDVLPVAVSRAWKDSFNRHGIDHGTNCGRS